MDIKNLRDMMRGWYHTDYNPLTRSPDEEYDEAARAIRALKSLFEQELRQRQAMTKPAETGCDDGTE